MGDAFSFPITLSCFSLCFSTFEMDKFEKIRPHHWKEHLKTSEIAKFESDTSLASEQSCENLQTPFVWWVGGKFVPPSPPPHTNVYKISRL